MTFITKSLNINACAFQTEATTVIHEVVQLLKNMQLQILAFATNKRKQNLKFN